MVGHKDPPREHCFKKGQIANPKGRPKLPTLPSLLEKYLAEKSERREGLNRLESLVQTLYEKAEAGDVKALQEVLDRTFGKSKATIENTNLNVDITHDSWVKEVTDDVEAKKQTN